MTLLALWPLLTPGKVPSTTLWPLGEEAKDLFPCAVLFSWLIFVYLYLRGHNPHSRLRWCLGNGEGHFPFLHPDQNPSSMAHGYLGWGLPGMGVSSPWEDATVWRMAAGWGLRQLHMVGASLHSPGTCLETKLKKKPETSNSQLSSLPSSVNIIAFSFFRCLHRVSVLPSHWFKWGLLFSTAAGLMSFEGKRHGPDAAGAGGSGEVSSPHFPQSPSETVPPVALALPLNNMHISALPLLPLLERSCKGVRPVLWVVPLWQSVVYLEKMLDIRSSSDWG